MARPLRVEFPGAWYHVMNRGGGRRQVFPNGNSCVAFIDLISEIHHRFQVECHAYCLMGNHYHLLLRTPLANLGRAMRHLDGVYTQRHNRRFKTDGPLFRGRYKAQLIGGASYLWRVSRYVHRNPLAAGLCTRLADYPWSSYPVFAGDINGTAVPAWLYMQETLAQFGTARDYCRFVDADGETQHDALILDIDATHQPAILGDKAFIASIRQRIEPGYEIPESKTVDGHTGDIGAILDLACRQADVSSADVISARNKQARCIRSLVMTVAYSHAGFRLREISDYFGFGSYTSVSSAVCRFKARTVLDASLAAELASLIAAVSKMRCAYT